MTTLMDVTHGLFLATKAMDLTRPVLDVSGYLHFEGKSDIYDSHEYTQDPEILGTRIGNILKGGSNKEPSIPYKGQPFFISEFGGIFWNPQNVDHNGDDKESSWGYGKRPENIEAFFDRFENLCGILMDNPKVFGYCYTQLTDVFQEQNGIYTFDRKKKFDINRIRKIQQRPAAIELHAQARGTCKVSSAKSAEALRRRIEKGR